MATLASQRSTRNNRSPGQGSGPGAARAQLRLCLAPALLLLGAVLSGPARAGAASPPPVTQPPAVARSYQTATLLVDGGVLLAGGSNTEASAEVFDPTTGTWRFTGPMTEARATHTATLLPDGRVLVTGGSSGRDATASTEIYDPVTDDWAPAAPMTAPRGFHTATLMPDGRVLVVGGQAAGHGPFQRQAELFDPVAGTWFPAGEIEVGRSFHTATLLDDGTVLVTGGQGAPHGSSLSDAVLYRPQENRWVPVPHLMGTGRAEHTASRLPGGRVLLAGGSARRQGSTPDDDLASAEIYDPEAQEFLPAPSLPEPRRLHRAVALPTGRVLLVGGYGPDKGERSARSSLPLYDPIDRQWTSIGRLEPGREDQAFTATLLDHRGCGQSCGRVLVVEGQTATLVELPPAESAAVVAAIEPAASGSTTSRLPVVLAVTGGVVLALLVAALAWRRSKAGGRARSSRSSRAGQAAATARSQRVQQRDVAFVTTQAVMPEEGRTRHRRGPTGGLGDDAVRAESDEVLRALGSGVEALRSALPTIAVLRRPRLLGRAEEEQERVERGASHLADARIALGRDDYGECGAAVREAVQELGSVGNLLTVPLDLELEQTAMSRAEHDDLRVGATELARCQETHRDAKASSPRAGALALAPLLSALAATFTTASGILAAHPPASAGRRPPTADPETQIIPSDDLETFADVGGLDDVKVRLARSVRAILDGAGDGRSAGGSHNGILLYGPPGTGKTLLARALAGENGLRFIRFSPALIASSFQHEPARKLRQFFAGAAEAAPCLLFLDEVDSIGGRRDSQASADQRELATQLLQSMEEYRAVPGLVMVAATNDVDHLDPALREGRFDTRIAVPLPDAAERADVIRVQLEQRGEIVDWDRVDLDGVARLTAGRSGAALASLVSGAAARALEAGGRLGQAELVAEVEGRSGQDRPRTIEERVSWDEVVLPDETRQRLGEILLVFQQPELGRTVGVKAPAGILLYGPPGTGKTTIAKALATEVRASFYEMSGADLLSKWVGESEQRVADLFRRARENRPSIIFIDEIDSLLKRRSADSSAPWEERVVTQFLRELDGLVSSEGVLLVGSTNRVDIIDEAVRDRRLVAIEVPYPDHAGRLRLLELLCAGVHTAPDVDLAAVADATGGLSGADLKAVRDGAGMKALTSAAREGRPPVVTAADFAAVLTERGLPQVRAKANNGSKK